MAEVDVRAWLSPHGPALRRFVRHPEGRETRVPDVPDDECARLDDIGEQHRSDYAGGGHRVEFIPALLPCGDAARAGRPTGPNGIGYQVHRVRDHGHGRDALRDELSLRADRHYLAP